MIRNSGLNNAEHNSTGSGPLWRIGKEEILPVYDEGFDAALGKIVADLKTTVINVLYPKSEKATLSACLFFFSCINVRSNWKQYL